MHNAKVAQFIHLLNDTETSDISELYGDICLNCVQSFKYTGCYRTCFIE